MTTIKLKNGSGAPAASDLVQGEPALDLTNKRLYTEDSGGSVIEIGTNPTSLTTGTFTSTGIDDNASSTVMTIASSGKTTFTGDVTISEATPSITLDDADNADGELQIVQSSGSSFYRSRGVSGNGVHVFQRNNGTDVLKVFQTNTSGDVIFYENDGVTSGLTWDASASKLTSFTSTGIDDNATSTAITIDSSENVGIGTASPSFSGFGSSTGGIDITNSANASLRLNGNAADAMFFVSGSGQHWLYGKGAVPMTFSTNGTERMRIDSSGNLSVGTTSAVTDSISLEQAFNLSWAESANSSYANVFRQRSSAATVLASGYKRSETSNKMDSSIAASWGKTAVWAGSESIRFYTDAASADAVGTDLTPTERMRINSSGNVGIGTTNPDNNLHISDTTAPILRFERNDTTIGTGNGIGQIQFEHQETSYAGVCATFRVEAGNNNGNGEFVFENGVAGTVTEKMRIDRNGNVGIGASTVNRKLELAGNNNGGAKANYLRITDTDTSATLANQQGGIEFYTSDSGNEGVTASIEVVYAGSGAGGEITFNTAASGGAGVTEAMRIDESGNLLVTTTDTPNTIRTSSTAGDTGIALEAASPYVVVSRDNAAANIYTNKPNQSTSTATDHIQFRQAGTLVGEITYDGTDIIINQSSDARLKENIQDSDSGLEIINTAQVRCFDWLNNARQSKRFGFVAQELHKVFPDAVRVGGEDPVSDPWSISEAKLIPVLTKAVQELSAQVTELKAEVAALKGA